MIYLIHAWNDEVSHRSYVASRIEVTNYWKRFRYFKLSFYIFISNSVKNHCPLAEGIKKKKKEERGRQLNSKDASEL